MFYYTISKETDTFIFKCTENILDENLHGFTKGKLLVDVDGSAFITCRNLKETITLSNNFDIDAVLIDSTIERDFLETIALVAFEK